MQKFSITPFGGNKNQSCQHPSISFEFLSKVSNDAVLWLKDGGPNSETSWSLKVQDGNNLTDFTP